MGANFGRVNKDVTQSNKVGSADKSNKLGTSTASKGSVNTSAMQKSINRAYTQGSTNSVKAVKSAVGKLNNTTATTNTDALNKVAKKLNSSTNNEKMATRIRNAATKTQSVKNTDYWNKNYGSTGSSGTKKGE